MAPGSLRGMPSEAGEDMVVMQQFDPDGKVVKKVGVHYDSSWCLRGLRITYNDDTVSRVGSAQDSYKEILLAPGEKITSASLWGNGVGTRTGRIRFVTNRGQILDAGKDTSGQTEYPMEFGSGILVGFAGRANVDIDALSFIFLRLVDSVELRNVQYQQPPSHTIRPTSLISDVEIGDRDSTLVQDWEFRNEVERTNATSFTSETTQTFGMDIKITAGVPEIASAEVGFHWEVGKTQSITASSSTTVKLAWALSGTLEPGQVIVCQAMAQYRTADVEYTAEVVLRFRNGTVKTYNEKGVMRTTQWAFATASAREVFAKENEEDNPWEGRFRPWKSPHGNGNDHVIWIPGNSEGRGFEGQVCAA